MDTEDSTFQEVTSGRHPAAPTKETEMAKLRYWMGDTPETCDLHPEHKITNTFIDGRVREAGSWANMCPECHATYGVGLGQGHGQKYEKRQIDGKTRWVKIGG